MYCSLTKEETEQVHTDYARALLMVARYGDRRTRRFFIQRHAESIGGYAAYLLHLGDCNLRTTFQDAARAQHSVWPRTLMGLRLAVPKRLEKDLRDPWRTWRDLADYSPRGLEIDPVCHMFVDPGETASVIVRGGRAIYFCSEGCRDIFEVQKRLDVALFSPGGDLGSPA